MHIINPKSDLTPKASIECGAKSSVNHSRIPVSVRGRSEDYRRSQSGIAECKCHINM